MNIRKEPLIYLIGLAFITALMTACTQMPTEKQSVTDMRPQLSFRILDDSFREARIYVDGLDMGPIGDYVEGVASLRVLSGSHQIRVDMNGRAIVEEKLYVGDGVNRTILVK
mgnify:CR=1 FL=1